MDLGGLWSISTVEMHFRKKAGYSFYGQYAKNKKRKYMNVHGKVFPYIQVKGYMHRVIENYYYYKLKG